MENTSTPRLRGAESNLHPVMALAMAPFLGRVATHHKLGIDVRTKNANELVRRLKGLATTIEVRLGGEYWMDRTCCQVHVTTYMTEDQLDNWLYTACTGIEWLGVFQRGDAA